MRRKTAAAATALLIAVAACTSGQSNDEVSTSVATSPESTQGTGSGATSSSEPTGTAGLSLVWAKEADPAGINPLKNGDIHSFELFTLVYEPLVRPADDLSPSPGLAVSWNQVSDIAWQFVLREGVQFSNGREMTAEDVVGTWDALKDLNIIAFIYPTIEGMSVVDTSTVEVTTTEPTPDLPTYLEWFWVLPAREMTDGSFNPDEELLGTGPFVVVDHVPGTSWTFQRNPNYWQSGLPIADSVEIRIIPDDASRVAAVVSGEADFAITGNPDVGAILAANDDVGVVIQDTTDLYYLALNNVWSESKFIDRRVRQAVAWAIDRQAIIDTALGGLGDVTAITPVSFGDSCDPTTMPGAGGRDLDLAQSLLEEAGIEDLSVRLTVVPYFGAPRAPEIAQVIQQNLLEVGVQTEIAVLDGGAWIEETFTNGTFDATINWWTGGASSSHLLGFMDPVKTGFDAMFVADDAETVPLVREALASPVGPERVQANAAACEALGDLANVIPLATKPTSIIYRSDRISPVFVPTEPVQMTFRDLAQFAPAN